MMKRTGDYFKRQHKWLFSIVAVGIALCFAACKSNDEVAVTSPFDPSKAVTITDFVPKTGGGGQRLVVYGSNFGTDTSLVKVMVGGMPAVLVSVKGNALYCYVPSKAYSGKIQVSVGRGDSTQTATATENFSYETYMIVFRQRE